MYISIIYIYIESPVFLQNQQYVLLELLICPEMVDIYTPVYATWGPWSLGPTWFCKSNSQWMYENESAVEYVKLN